MTINPKAPEKEVQQKLIDISTEFNLTQVHDTQYSTGNAFVVCFYCVLVL
jgi:hypothetical protein